jgi:hypothetical protein
MSRYYIPSPIVSLLAMFRKFAGGKVNGYRLPL